MRTIKLTLEYDGTNFYGWQYQPNLRTVQGEIERGLKSLLQETVTVIGSGRTDAGVHASGQVAHFRTHSLLPLESIRLGLNALTHDDLVVLGAEEVSADFHARYSATRRWYRYKISLRQRAIGRHYAWFCKYPLDLTAIREASQLLIGEHDFEAFCQAGAETPHFLSRVEEISWTEQDDTIVFDIVANRFLHNMVRIIVGTMVMVGRGKLTPADVADILEKRDRKLAGFTVPAHGLCLMKVYYD
jgi:tRNA pseudouridine38-40 synthase